MLQRFQNVAELKVSEARLFEELVFPIAIYSNILECMQDDLAGDDGLARELDSLQGRNLHFRNPSISGGLNIQRMTFYMLTFYMLLLTLYMGVKLQKWG